MRRRPAPLPAGVADDEAGVGLLDPIRAAGSGAQAPGFSPVKGGADPPQMIKMLR
jgi:hypothetical protein